MNLLSHPSGESGYHNVDMQIWAGVGTFSTVRLTFALIIQLFFLVIPIIII